MAKTVGAPQAREDHVEFRELTKLYGELTALAGISFKVKKGEFVSIIGPSGCGKSTLLKILLGVVPYTSGTALLNQTVVDGPQPGAGMVFQTSALPPWRRVLDNVLLPIEVLGRSTKDYEPRARELLNLAGLAGFERRYPAELSGGMQQRVSICRALIHEPSLLLMDEPFGALDALTREVMQGVLLKIWAETHKTVLLVTHSIDEAVLLSNRVIVLSARPGVVMEDLTIDLPEERTPAVRGAAPFQSYARRLRQLLGLVE